MITVIKLNEAGFDEAMLGLSLNKNQPVENMPIVAFKLSKADGGHNKFLEHIIVWLDVTAPRWWWQQADTYRIASKSSQSTMHTILKRPLNQNDFQYPISEDTLSYLNQLIAAKDLERLKNELPEGFLQRRMWVVSYKTLRNILNQRGTHRMPEWQEFESHILNQVAHPELLTK